MARNRFSDKAEKAASIVVTLWVFFLSGCHSNPDHVVTFRSPKSPVYYTVETSYGHGPVSNDYTDIYGHFDHGGSSDRQLALNGPYLENATVTWTSPTEVEFCIGDGRTIEFRNHLYLSTKDNAFIEIHERLDETCQREPISARSRENAN
jgi:hypothetical protein